VGGRFDIYMEIFGLPIQTLYLYILCFSGGIIVLYILFGDVLEGAGEVSPFLNPIVIFAFLTIFSAAGFLMEYTTGMGSIFIIAISASIAFILDIILYLFVLIPLSNAEESLVYTDESLRGRVGKVIIPIPDGGFGEVLIESVSGRIAKPAQSFKGGPIEEGQEVLIIEVNENVLQVVRHEGL
jgi:membrane-bound ClpP family serine protease